MKLENKVAVITGGTTGIGFATAKRFIDEGAHVVFTGRTQSTLDAAQAELGERALGVRGDVAKLADLDRLYATVKQRFGRVDTLFANAGVARFAPAEQVDEAFFDSLFDINVKGLFFTVTKALPLMSKGGTIVRWPNGSEAKLFGAHGPSRARKAGRVLLLRCAIPSCCHHRRCAEQSTITRQIDRETRALIVVSIRMIPILRRVHHQCIDGSLRLADARCRHRDERVVPTPGVRPLPVRHHALQRTSHCRAINARRRDEAVRAEQRRVVASLVLVGECLRRRLSVYVEAIAHGHRTQRADDAIPRGIAREAKTLSPTLRRLEPERPVCELEGGVERRRRRMTLLRRN